MYLVGVLFAVTPSAAAVVLVHLTQFFAAVQYGQHVNQLAQYENEMKLMRKEKVSTSEYKRDHPETSLIASANNLENEISKLNKTKKMYLEKEQTPYVKAEIKRIEDQKVRMMTNFNKRFSAAEK